MDHDIPGIAESSFTVLSAIVTVSPSVLVTVITDRAPIKGLSGRRRDRQTRLHADRRTHRVVLYIRTLTAL